MRSQGPTFYPVACSPQAWSATAPIALLRSCLGLGFEPETGSVTFNRPVLPAFLDEVVLRGLSLGAARVDVALQRAGDEVAVHVVRREGDIRVLTTS
jgi:glycogen debranching enzyme